MDTLQQQFGNLIRKRRHATGLGQEALADKANLHRTHVSLLERGKRMPSLLVVKKLAAALDTTMASLMRELEQELENANALMVTKKKTLGLKGAKQFLAMDAASSKIRFVAKKDIVFFIKTSGDVIDLTSYIKLYQFQPVEQKREATINAKEGLLIDKDEAKGKLMSFRVKMISKDNYQVQLPEQLEAGEYGFVWVKNMELKEFTVFAFGINWKSSD